jgi:hypothetical protein
MNRIKIRFDPTDNTLIVWFDELQNMAYLSPLEDAAAGDLHLIKNEAGQVIGFEGQFYHISPCSLTIEMETAPMMDKALKANS